MRVVEVVEVVEVVVNGSVKRFVGRYFVRRES
jgi:hypothetical protein